jgi:hypothetical protein
MREELKNWEYLMLCIDIWHLFTSSNLIIFIFKCITNKFYLAI